MLKLTMCAEYTPGPPMELDQLLNAVIVIRDIIRDDWINYRVFPRGMAPIILKNQNGDLEVVEAEFSLIPSWWNPEKALKKTKNGRPMFATHNARLESIDEKPTFKDSFKNRHCLVPMTKFFESSLFGEKFAGNRISLSTGGIMLATGCYSEWIDKSTGEIVWSFTIITYHPNKTIFEAGHDRMPVFLDRKAAMEWLGNEGQDLDVLKEFLFKKMINQDLKLDIAVDRALKDGWQKNAPEEKDLEEIRALVYKKA